MKLSTFLLYDLRKSLRFIHPYQNIMDDEECVNFIYYVSFKPTKVLTY